MILRSNLVNRNLMNYQQKKVLLQRFIWPHKLPQAYAIKVQNVELANKSRLSSCEIAMINGQKDLIHSFTVHTRFQHIPNDDSFVESIDT